jgi:hypothetical protein
MGSKEKMEEFKKKMEELKGREEEKKEGRFCGGLFSRWRCEKKCTTTHKNCQGADVEPPSKS